MATKIDVNRYCDGDEQGWDPNNVSAHDYRTPRARALYDAIGASLDDEEYCLAEGPGGRWAIFGLTVNGHRWAAERQ